MKSTVVWQETVCLSSEFNCQICERVVAIQDPFVIFPSSYYVLVSSVIKSSAVWSLRIQPTFKETSELQCYTVDIKLYVKTGETEVCFEWSQQAFNCLVDFLTLDVKYVYIIQKCGGSEEN